MRSGFAFGPLVVLKDGEHESGSKNRDQPNQLSLPDFLAVFVDAALKDADGEPGLKSDHGQNESPYDNFECSHDNWAAR